MEENDEESVDSRKFDFKFKLMVIGESKVGKTSVIKRYTKNKFGGIYLTTVGVDFQSKIIEIDGKKIMLQIWDTAGQERFRNIARNYFHSSNGFLLIYDISEKDSLNKLNYWIDQIKLNAPESAKSVLIGNKCDLNNERQISKEEGEEFAKKYNTQFYEVSAKDGTNIKEAFEYLGNEIYREIKKKGKTRTESHVLTKNSNKKKKKSCC